MTPENTNEISTLRACSFKSKTTRIAGSTLGIFSEVEIPPVFRGRGLGDKFHKLRLTEAKENYGIDYVVCTVNADNDPELKILQRNGWKEISQYGNDCEHTVIVFGKEL